MKKFFLSIVVASICIFLACKKQGDNTNPQQPVIPVIPMTAAPITAGIQGNVVDENEQPIAGVSISVGTQTSTTDGHGSFRINNASLDKYASLLTGSMPGYFEIIRSFAATSGLNYQRIKLIKKKLVGTIKSSLGGNIIITGANTISLPANGFVKKSALTSPYNGDVNIYAALIDPTTNDFSETVPGSLIANDSTNKRVGLQSFGMMVVELESTAGEPLQIAAGQTAQITLSIPSSLQANAPASVPLWYLDETTGIWKQEGTAVKSGSSYTGKVSHFSFWNYDLPYGAVVLTLTIKDSKNNPLQFTMVKLVSTNHGSASGYTDSLGQVSGMVPYNEKLSFSLINAGICTAATSVQDIGPFTGPTSLTITVDSITSPNMVTLKGKLVDCNNAGLSKGSVIVYQENTHFNVPIDGTGNFSLSLLKCSANSTVNVYGLDSLGQQQSLANNVVLSSSTVDMGNISACGQSTVRQVKAVIDGANYDVSDSTDYYNNGNLYLDVFAQTTKAPYLDVSFGILYTTNTGSYPLSFLSYSPSQGTYYNAVNPTNIIANITSIPNFPGQFFTGNFSGNFKTADSVNHTITCTFNVKRLY
jgi:hypothetical protein